MDNMTGSSGTTGVDAGTLAGDSTPPPLDSTNSPVESRAYDFAHPAPLRPAQLHALRLAAATACTSLQTTLGEVLRQPVEVQFLMVEQSTYHDYLAASDELTSLAIYQRAGSPERWLLETNRALAFALIDCLLGGTVSGVTLSRPFTEVEGHLLKKGLTPILQGLSSELLPKESLEMTQLICDASLIAEATSNAAVALISLEVAISSRRGLVQLCIPWKEIPQTSTFLQSTNRGNPERMRKVAGQVPVILTARIARLKLAARDIANLGSGDVLVTDTLATSEICLEIDNRELFRGTSGQTHNRKSFLVTAAVGSKQESSSAAPSGK